ncbi:MAG: right-handed parallel beta-helix repeat-containing protein [Mesorhizobium sp.]
MAVPTGFPDASNTGVQDGVNLSVYTGPMTITKDGTVIENMIINGSLRITADNVIIKNCKIIYNDYRAIDAEGAKNFTLMYNDIIGPGKKGQSVDVVLASGNILYNDISGGAHGINVAQGTNTVVKGNYIHDLAHSSSDAHIGGISVKGGQNGLLIEGNTVIATDTSNIFIDDDFGQVHNVIVRDNYLGGDPGYNIYVAARYGDSNISNVSIYDNYISKGYYGYYSIYHTNPSISGNAEVAAGSAVPKGDYVPDPVIDTPNVPSTPSTPTTPTKPNVPSTPSQGSSDHVSKAIDGTSKGEKLVGTSGDDHINGKGGTDYLTGGAGKDIFVFDQVAHMGSGNKRDVITDFQKGLDKIDISAIDANGSIAGDGVFHFIAQNNAVFDHKPGAIAWRTEDYKGTSKDVTIIQGDINGDGIHDFEIQLKGLVHLTKDDFIL